MKQSLLVVVFLGYWISISMAECPAKRTILGGCLLLSGDFGIGNCTDCISARVPEIVDGVTAASAAATNGTAVDGEATNGTGGECNALDGLLCEVVEACSSSCAGLFCTEAFKSLVVCEANALVRDCTLSADSCQITGESAAFDPWKFTASTVSGLGILGMVASSVLL